MIRFRWLLLPVLLVTSLFYTACPDPAPHVGQWITSGGEVIQFNSDASFRILSLTRPDPASHQGQPAPRVPEKGWRVLSKGTYVIDYSKDPAWIDLVVTDPSTPRRKQGLIRFLDENTFYMAVEDVRPASIENSSRRARYTRAAPNEITPVIE